ncbi:SR-related and CTD-associated factor 4b isoform X1 [Danio rerio]|uniref:SR-related and CTD-associated factor 4b isoform X1 n=1 Tax=Danio rerio TaxID=7955 RepID=A0AB32T2M6_DANRE
MDMEAVNAFNGEMSSMMDMTPPISRAKMMSVTKAGIKAIRLYKHVVQIVEKFIKRCKPDLKVPGLYVVDSIIRQSRHQFGADKDLFGPRFLKNFTVTFQNLFECPEDDKGKILRVLNLWQKNEVFGLEIIQPLVDMATAPVLPVLENGTTVTAIPVEVPVPVLVPVPAPGPAPVPVPVPILEPAPALAPAVVTAAPPPTLQTPVPLAAVAQLLQGTGGVELQQLLQTLQQAGGAGPPQPKAPPTEKKPSLAKSLLDRFDYDDEPEPVEEKPEPAPAAPITINLPTELQQALQAHLLSQIVNQTQMQAQMPPQVQMVPQVQIPPQAQMPPQIQMPPQAQMPPQIQMPPQVQMQPQMQVPFQGEMASQEFPAMVQTQQIPENTQVYEESMETSSTTNQPQAVAETERSAHDGREKRRSRRTRSRSPHRQSSSSSRSRRSRSGSRSRRERSRYHRTRSRSRERRGRSPRPRSEERRDRDKEREREKERRQKAEPSVKKETLSVCTTTLWIGQLDKKTQRQDITSLMEEFGQIESINMIPPRGCAYVAMVHRQDAQTALNKLSKTSVKVNQKTIKIAWAMNKGIKSEYKKFWDVERGITFIPWGKVKPNDIQSLQEGGLFDPETLKPEWKAALAKKSVPASEGPEGNQEDGAALPMVSQSTPVQPVPVPVMNVVSGPPPIMSLPPPGLITGASPPPFLPPPVFSPTQMPPVFRPIIPPVIPSAMRPVIPPVIPPAIPVASVNPAVPPASVPETAVEEASEEPLKSPITHVDSMGPQALSPPPGMGAGLMRPRLGPPHTPVRLRPPFMPAFPNMPRPVHPPPSVAPQMMPPRVSNPTFSDAPPVRFRMLRMRPPGQEFPPQRFPRAPRPEEPHWREQGAERAPLRFRSEPPFLRFRGAPRIRSPFGN